MNIRYLRISTPLAVFICRMGCIAKSVLGLYIFGALAPQILNIAPSSFSVFVCPHVETWELLKSRS
jgi:hypothetical protein